MNELTEEWVAKAENDFISADLLLHAGAFPVPDTACFHCQQCAEKYLKAYLQEHNVRFERRHDLMPLLELCLTLDQGFEILRSDLQQLENFSISVRYPGVDVSPEIAKEALVAATKVRGFVRKKLKVK